MTSEVETMMYSGMVPWHKLGEYVGDKPVTSKEAIVKAGLDWNVDLHSLYAMSHQGEALPVEDSYGVVRQSDNKVLGVVGSKYAPVQNRDAFSFFDSLVDGKVAMYHTAGSLRGGKIIWVLAQLPGEIKVANKDNIQKFLLLTNTHDGSGCVKVFFTPVRVVCNNTLSMALRKRGQNETVNIRHIGDIMDKLDAAKQTLGIAQQYYENFEKTANILVKMPLSDKQTDKILRKLFDVKQGMPENEIHTRTLNNMNTIKHLAVQGVGLEDFRGTAYGLWQACTEYSDHHRTIREPTPERRAESIWIGSGATFKQKSLDLISQNV